MDSYETFYLKNGLEVPTRGAVGQPVLTPQELRAEIARERREAVKERQLDRRTKRQNKRSQCY